MTLTGHASIQTLHLMHFLSSNSIVQSGFCIMAAVGHGETHAPQEVHLLRSKVNVEMISCTLTPSASKADMTSLNFLLSAGTSTIICPVSGVTCASRMLMGIPVLMIVLASTGRLVTECVYTSLSFVLYTS
jgi:hypothetical protein